MTTLEELQELCLEIQVLTKLDDIKWQKRFGNDEGLYGLIKAEREAYANQLSEERVREAYRQGIDDALYNPITMTPEAIAARNARLASLNKPQETRPQTNGDLVEDPATGITIFPKAAKPDSRPLPNSHGK